MRAIIQRVTQASLSINQIPKANIKKGLLVLVGIETSDSKEDILWLSKKIVNLRIFQNEEGIKDLSLLDIAGELLVVSQFTLHARVKKGNRPAYVDAAKPEIAEPLYLELVQQLEQDLGMPVSTGVFGANMQIELINDGPVTIFIDTQNKQ